MIIERLINDDSTVGKVYFPIEWIFESEGHWVKDGFIRHKEIGGQEACCEKFGKAERLYLTPVLQLGDNRVKMLYLSDEEYACLCDLRLNVDVGLHPVKIIRNKSDDAVDVRFMACIAEDNMAESIKLEWLSFVCKDSLVDMIARRGVSFKDVV